MSVFNSSAGYNDDDEMTMINQSFVFGDTNETADDSVVRRLQQVNRARSTTNPTSDYVYVEHDRLENARQIEQILNFYRQDLQQSSNTQYACNTNLIRRLIDAIRPIYSSNESQMKDLHKLFEDISDLQDVRFIEQKEKFENLTNEIAHLKKLILGTTKTEKEEPNSNPIAKAFQINSMVNYEQWQRLEDETKHLQNLVESQQAKISELVQLLISENNPLSVSTKPRKTDVPKSESTVDERRAIAVQNLRTLSRLPSSSTTTNEPPSQICPICNHKFRYLTTEIDIDAHIDKCLTSLDKSNTSTTFKQYECPQCQRHFPENDEVYLQHLNDCLNKLSDQIKYPKIRICPLCQAIFNVTSMNDQQYQRHIEAHS